MTHSYVKTIAKNHKKIKIKFVGIDQQKNTKMAKNGIFSNQDVIKTYLQRLFYKTSSHHQYHRYSIYPWITYQF